jgi:hypothetical protein
VTDFLDQTHREITERLKELRPLVDEFKRLEAAALALAGAVGSAAADAGQAVRRRGPGRPRKTPSTPTPAATPNAGKTAGKPAPRTAKRPAGRRKGTGRRSAQALSFVQAQPGITVSELASKMDISPNYLYRVLPGLQKEGKIRKDGRGWHPTTG